MVSVVIPAYKAEKTLEAAVRSVQRQTWRELEILIVDDCSPDATGEIAEALAAEDPRIRCFHNQVNRGVSYNRNFGVAQARGEYVAFLDSDDLWRSDKLERQMDLAAAHPEASLFYTGSGFITAEGRRCSYVFRVPVRIDFKRLSSQNVISCSSVLARRETMLATPMENDAVHEDFAVWLRVLRREAFAYGVDEPLLIYRISAQSKSGNKLRSAKMTFDTYRFAGIPPLRRLWCFGAYTIRSLRKYRGIRSSVTEEEYVPE